MHFSKVVLLSATIFNTFYSMVTAQYNTTQLNLQQQVLLVLEESSVNIARREVFVEARPEPGLASRFWWEAGDQEPTQSSRNASADALQQGNIWRSLGSQPACPATPRG